VLAGAGVIGSKSLVFYLLSVAGRGVFILEQFQRGRVIGIGGIFLKSQEPQRLRGWYGENLGISAPTDSGAMLRWRAHDKPEQEHVTAWSVFPHTSTYFDPSTAPFMINYIVDDLDALLARLSTAGVQIDPKREDCDYGRFAWIFDPDGNKIELWEPPSGRDPLLP
jgi:catechol 2,3-dioxygenase-like lactoylglutathione lyase family enzyme